MITETRNGKLYMGQGNEKTSVFCLLEYLHAWASLDCCKLIRATGLHKAICSLRLMGMPHLNEYIDMGKHVIDQQCTHLSVLY